MPKEKVPNPKPEGPTISVAESTGAPVPDHELEAADSDYGFDEETDHGYCADAHVCSNGDRVYGGPGSYIVNAALQLI